MREEVGKEDPLDGVICNPYYAVLDFYRPVRPQRASCSAVFLCRHTAESSDGGRGPPAGDGHNAVITKLWTNAIFILCEWLLEIEGLELLLS